jgi:hypothetical protein
MNHRKAIIAVPALAACVVLAVACWLHWINCEPSLPKKLGHHLITRTKGWPNVGPIPGTAKP